MATRRVISRDRGTLAARPAIQHAAGGSVEAPTVTLPLLPLLLPLPLRPARSSPARPR